jgi:hypothetical protein
MLAGIFIAKQSFAIPPKSSRPLEKEWANPRSTGRVSGQPRKIEIWFTEQGGHSYLVAERENANGVRNIQSRPQVASASFSVCWTLLFQLLKLAKFSVLSIDAFPAVKVIRRGSPGVLSLVGDRVQQNCDGDRDHPGRSFPCREPGDARRQQTQGEEGTDDRSAKAALVAAKIWRAAPFLSFVGCSTLVGLRRTCAPIPADLCSSDRQCLPELSLAVTLTDAVSLRSKKRKRASGPSCQLQ